MGESARSAACREAAGCEVRLGRLRRLRLLLPPSPPRLSLGGSPPVGVGARVGARVGALELFR